MSSVTLRRVLLTVALVTGVATAADPLEAAGPSAGAKCPTGFTAEFNATTRVLKCKKSRTEFADVACPPPTALANVEIVRRQGADKCKIPLTPLPGNPATLPTVVCVALPGTSGWVLQTDRINSFNDRCTRTVVEFACPTCSPI